MALASGARLGPYEILAPLGVGGMGEVYRARDTRLGREVAVKVLPATLTSDPLRLRRFEQEARAAGVLNHPNVLAIYDVGRHEHAPYVVSELLEGDTLRDRMAGAPLPIRKALDYATQITEGLAAAHEKGIVHRDLKPENVFVTRDGRVKILDFGLAKLTEPWAAGEPLPERTLEATEPGAVLGTAGYMSPEQVRGRPADHRSDIFSFGCLLYEMLSGRRAFQGESAVETMNAILKEDPLETSGLTRVLPGALEHALRRCLEKSPEERFQSARDLAFDLKAVPALSTASAAHPAFAAPRLSRTLARGGALALLAAGLLAAAYVAGRGSRAPEPPALHQLTFRRGTVLHARFAPDAQTVLFSALWDGRPVEVFSTRPGTPEARSLGLPTADLLALSRGGELALGLGGFAYFGLGQGTLARAPLGGGAPRQVVERVQQADFAPDGRELAVVRNVEGKRRLEYPIGSVLHETTGWLSHPRVSPEGGRVALIEHPLAADDRGSVVVLDRRGGRSALVEEWSSAQGLAWSPDGREVWFTGTESGYARALYAVAPGGRPRLLLRVAGPLTLLDVSRDGRALLAHSLDRFGMVVRPPGSEQEREVSWLDRSISTDLSADGRTLLFYESGEGGGAHYGVYLRGTDGSPAVRLGEGLGTALSPDAAYALSIVYASPPRLVLLPTGPGQPRTLPRGPLELYLWAGFFPEGRRLLLSAREAGRRSRLYAQDLEGGPPRPISPEGVGAGFFNPILPDGRALAGVDATRMLGIYPLAGGNPTPILTLAPGEAPVRWSRDGRALYLFSRLQVPAHVEKLDLATLARTHWRELVPADPAGVITIASIQIAADEQSYAYTYGRVLSDLYLVEGLR